MPSRPPSPTDAGPAGFVATGSLKGDLAAARVRLRPRAGLRTRKAYRVTPAGEQLFVELLADETADDERTFALKLSFCRHLGAAERLAFLERRRAQLTQRLAKTKRNPGGTPIATPGRSSSTGPSPPSTISRGSRS